jgi:phosphatidylserine/phosphatidylglycerophosphate/cardiolipin synthase-like enzyme
VKPAPSKDDREVFTVCHQKFLVIDKKTVIVESANWAKSSVPQITQVGGFRKANREWLVRIDSPKVAEWFAGLFEADWNIPESVSAAVTTPAVGALPDVAVAAAVTRPAKIFDFQALADPQAKLLPVVSPDNYLKQVKSLLKGAKKSIYLQQQYVLAGKGVKDLVAILAQKRADNPAFDIRVVSSAAFPKNWQGTKLTLQSAGLLGTLRAINPDSFGHCHNKGVLVDGKSVVVSSTNWSENSITRAREAGVLIHSAKIAKYYEEVFLLDWKEGKTPAEIDASLAVIDGADVL